MERPSEDRVLVEGDRSPKVAMDRLPYQHDAVEPVAGPVPVSLSAGAGAVRFPAGAREVLCRFRWDVYAGLGARADALFELADAVACAGGPVRSLPELSLEPEHRRGHGGLYDALNAGRIEFARIRRALAGLVLPRVGEGIVLGVDVTPWLRPDAETSPQRLFCHVHGRAKGTSQMIPGWPYSIVAALETGRTSWTAVLDAVRLGPHDDATVVTAAQLRDVVERLIAAGHQTPADPAIEIVMDSGYDVTGPSRVSPPPSEDHPSGRSTETHPTRPRQTTRHPQPAPRAPLRRRQDHETRRHPGATQPKEDHHELKIKLRRCGLNTPFAGSGR
jgi:hypothetical protein